MNRLLAAELALVCAVTVTGDAKRPADPNRSENNIIQAADQLKHPDVDVLLIDNGVTGDYLSEQEVGARIKQAGDALAYSTLGARSIGDISITPMTQTPAGKGKLGDHAMNCYTDEQYEEDIKKLQERRSNVGKEIISIVAFNSNVSCGALAVPDRFLSGFAVSDAATPKIMLNLIAEGTAAVALHEVGHLLGPGAHGLGHQAVIACWWNGKDGTLRSLPAAGTVQAQIANHCTLKKDKDGSIGEYSSRYSVMGRHESAYRGSRFENFSPPELTRLNPDLRTKSIDTTPAKYHLSYRPDDLYGVRLPLPPDSALRTEIPNAAYLYIGPVINSMPADDGLPSITNPDNTLRMMPFVETYDPTNPLGPSLTVALDSYLAAPIQTPADYAETKTSEEALIYADDQLGVAAVEGIDDDGPYVRILKLDATAAPIMQAAERQASSITKAIQKYS